MPRGFRSCKGYRQGLHTQNTREIQSWPVRYTAVESCRLCIGLWLSVGLCPDTAFEQIDRTSFVVFCYLRIAAVAAVDCGCCGCCGLRLSIAAVAGCCSLRLAACGCCTLRRCDCCGCRLRLMLLQTRSAVAPRSSSTERGLDASI